MATVDLHGESRRAAPRIHAGVYTTIGAAEVETILWNVEVRYRNLGARAPMAPHAHTIELPASVTRERAAIIAAALLDVSPGALAVGAI